MARVLVAPFQLQWKWKDSSLLKRSLSTNTKRKLKYWQWNMVLMPRIWPWKILFKFKNFDQTWTIRRNTILRCLVWNLLLILMVIHTWRNLTDFKRPWPCPNTPRVLGKISRKTTMPSLKNKIVLKRWLTLSEVPTTKDKARNVLINTRVSKEWTPQLTLSSSKVNVSTPSFPINSTLKIISLIEISFIIQFTWHQVMKQQCSLTNGNLTFHILLITVKTDTRTSSTWPRLNVMVKSRPMKSTDLTRLTRPSKWRNSLKAKDSLPSRKLQKWSFQRFSSHSELNIKRTPKILHLNMVLSLVPWKSPTQSKCPKSPTWTCTRKNGKRKSKVPQQRIQLLLIHCTISINKIKSILMMPTTRRTLIKCTLSLLSNLMKSSVHVKLHFLALHVNTLNNVLKLLKSTRVSNAWTPLPIQLSLKVNVSITWFPRPSILKIISLIVNPFTIQFTWQKVTMSLSRVKSSNLKRTTRTITMPSSTSTSTTPLKPKNTMKIRKLTSSTPTGTTKRVSRICSLKVKASLKLLTDSMSICQRLLPRPVAKLTPKKPRKSVVNTVWHMMLWLLHLPSLSVIWSHKDCTRKNGNKKFKARVPPIQQLLILNISITRMFNQLWTRPITRPNTKRLNTPTLARNQMKFSVPEKLPSNVPTESTPSNVPKSSMLTRVSNAWTPINIQSSWKVNVSMISSPTWNTLKIILLNVTTFTSQLTLLQLTKQLSMLVNSNLISHTERTTVKIDTRTSTTLLIPKSTRNQRPSNKSMVIRLMLISGILNKNSSSHQSRRPQSFNKPCKTPRTSNQRLMMPKLKKSCPNMVLNSKILVFNTASKQPNTTRTTFTRPSTTRKLLVLVPLTRVSMMSAIMPVPRSTRPIWMMKSTAKLVKNTTTPLLQFTIPQPNFWPFKIKRISINIFILRPDVRPLKSSRVSKEWTLQLTLSSLKVNVSTKSFHNKSTLKIISLIEMSFTIQFTWLQVTKQQCTPTNGNLTWSTKKLTTKISGSMISTPPPLKSTTKISKELPR